MLYVPYTTTGKNTMIDAIARGTAPALSIADVGLLTAQSGKSITGVASTGIFTSAAHGYSAGDLVVPSALTGGAGLIAGRSYYVIATNLATNTFSVSQTAGGAIVNSTSTVPWTTDVSAGTSTKLVEVSGGSPAYARIATAFAVAGSGVNDDNTSHVINVPAATTVNYVGYWSALTGGTLLAFVSVTAEVFAAQGTYSVTDGKLDLNAVA